MTRSARTIVIAVAFAVPAVLLVVSALVHKRQLIAKQKAASGQLELVRSHFAGLEYEPVADTPEFKSGLESVAIKDPGLLSPSQTSELKDTVYDLVVAFHTGTYDAYRRFRTPIEARFNEQAIAYHRKVLTNFYVPKDQKLPDSPEDIAKMIWEKDYDGNAFVDYWMGVCITNVQIEVSETNRMPEKLFTYARSLNNMGVREIMPTFYFSHSPEAILKESSHLLYATVILDVKPADPDPAFPVFTRYYWDDASAKWLPWEMSSGNSQKRKRDPMF